MAITDAKLLNKLLATVKEAKKQGATAQEVEDFLQSKGSSMAEMDAVMQHGADTIVKMRSPELKRQAQEMADKNNPTTVEYIKELLRAGGEGLLTGAETALNGATSCGYNWLNKSAEGRKQRFLQDAKDAGFGDAAQIVLTGTEIASALASPVNKLMPIGATTVGGKIAQGVATGGIYGGLCSGFASDFDTSDTIRGAIGGGAIGGAVPIAIEAGKGLLGLATGTGKKAIDQALQAGKRGSKEFLQNMRNQIDEMQVVSDAKDYVNKIKQQVSSEYLAGKSGMINKRVDIKPVLDSVDDIERSFNYKGLTTANPEEMRVIDQAKQYLGQLVKNKQAQDIGGVDAVKQAIGRINTSDPSGIRVRSQIYNSVKNVINKADPQYAKVMSKYETAAKSLDNISKELSVGKRGANPYTVLGKLQSSLRNDAGTRYGARTKAVESLGDTASKKILDAVAGQSFATIIPRGLTGRILGGLAGGSGMLSNRASLATLPLFSPRLVGETLYGLGRADRVIPSLSQALSAGAVLSNK